MGALARGGAAPHNPGGNLSKLSRPQAVHAGPAGPVLAGCRAGLVGCSAGFPARSLRKVCCGCLHPPWGCWHTSGSSLVWLSLRISVWVALVAAAVTVVRDSSLHRAPQQRLVNAALSVGTSVAALAVLQILTPLGTAVPRYCRTAVRASVPAIGRPADAYSLAYSRPDARASPSTAASAFVPRNTPGGVRMQGLTPAGGHPCSMDSPQIIVSGAYKGGVGKTTLALELAYLLDAPLVDLDWDKGGATKRWGYVPTESSPLLDALERGKTPRLRKGRGKADLVAGDRDLEANQPAPDDMADALRRWAADWGRPYVVVDTHPGGVPSTLGAMAAASVIVTPTILAIGELDGLEGLVEELGDYPLLVVPNRVPRTPDRRLLERLKDLVKRYELPVAPVISEHKRLPRRSGRMAVTAADPVPKVWENYATELRSVADAVRKYHGG